MANLHERMEKLKQYKVTPTVVVEDHNEVLPYIYRAIGSKHLPLHNLTLLHFDSHPDLLIPADMPAETVFRKQELFDSLSIENWILPSVYAGHISHVIWVKPPWCTQIDNKTVDCYVGKCMETGKIRISCQENYYLSEALYVPESRLDNKKALKITVHSLKPKDWDITQQAALGTQTVENVSHKRKDVNEGQSLISVDCCEKSEAQVAISRNMPFNNTASTDVLSGYTCAKQCGHVGKPANKKVKLISSIDEVLNDKSDQMKHYTKHGDKHCDFIKKDYKSNTDLELCDNLQHSCEHEIDKTIWQPADVDTLIKYLQGTHYILDIDLDFFSTMNPFQEMYGIEQYKILQQLYKFDKPLSQSEQDLQKCVSTREQQLSDLKNVFSKLEQDDNGAIKHLRADLITTLIRNIKTTSAVSIDYNILHEAGCTCDDTELPHHVSTNTEISVLIAAVQDLLSHLPKPTYVTIARSSCDDYCPANQVDMIQDNVLDMLQQLYTDIEVNMQYDEEHIGICT